MAKENSIKINRSKNQIPQETIEKILELFDEGNSLKDIVKKTNITARTVRKYLVLAGVYTPGDPNNYVKRMSVTTINRMRRLYIAGHPIKHIIEKIGCTKFTLYKYIKGLPRRNGELPVETQQKIIKMFKNGHSNTEIATAFGISFGTVRKYTLLSQMSVKNPVLNSHSYGIQGSLYIFNRIKFVVEQILRNHEINTCGIVRVSSYTQTKITYKGVQGISIYGDSHSRLTRNLVTTVKGVLESSEGSILRCGAGRHIIGFVIDLENKTYEITMRNDDGDRVTIKTELNKK